MRIVNVYNQKRTIFLFLRGEDKKLRIRKINNFYPYYYEPSTKGTYRGYDGTHLEKITLNDPREVPQMRSEDSYESDIVYTKRYIIDNVRKFDKTYIKYAFVDIEILHPEGEFPNPKTARFPVSSISLYNSKYNKIRNWCLLDYGVPEGTTYEDYKKDPKIKQIVKEAEIRLFIDFVTYLQKAKFDILMAWYMLGFDYPYLYNRFEKLPQDRFFERNSKYNNFAVAISPIGRVRGGSREFGNFFPAGTSIVDYLGWFKKKEKGRKSYALDYIMEEDLGQGKEYKDVNFTEITETVRKRNIGDVQGMVDLESKHKLISYYDELRRFAKVFWEDMEHNSRIIDSLILQEAKKKGVVLPKAHDIDKEDFEGAFREAFKTGAFYDIGKFDLGSAYPMAIVNFCLDPANIVDGNQQINHQIVDVGGTLFQQNQNGILPAIVKKLVDMKTELKTTLNNTKPDTEEYDELQKKYDAVKAVVNSAYGVMGNRFFRLYDSRVASATTFIVRKLLKDSVTHIEKDLGLDVIYVDTDSVFINTTKDISQGLNNFIKEWGKKEFGLPNVDIEFDYEGFFEDLLILAKCRYKGIVNKKGKGKTQSEEKGIEAKRKDSTKFMAEFQKELITKIFNIRKQKETKDTIVSWIKQQKDEIKKTPLMDIAFPCKLARNPDKYKNVPIFIRAIDYTKDLVPSFNKRIGELFYYIYVAPTGRSL